MGNTNSLAADIVAALLYALRYLALRTFAAVYGSSGRHIGGAALLLPAPTQAVAS